MNLLERFFGSTTTATQPAIRFGRFTDNDRTPEQEEAFEAALRYFHQENYLKAYASFFDYLFVETEQNLRVWEEKGELRFEFFQGSKRITGFANGRKLHAEAKIAKANSLQSTFMHRLLQENFKLKYSRFTLTPDNEIAIVFDTYAADGSPYKLYAALKELACRADKHDDILLDEFVTLEIIDFNLRREIPAAEKNTKIEFIHHKIQAVFDEMDRGKLSTEKYPVAFTYLLLDLCYKLDYLIKPEGYLMETLERVHRSAYSQDGKNAAQKNLAMREEFQKVLERPTDKLCQELYEVSTTFGITPPIDHQKVIILIEQELPNLRWYADNGHHTMAEAIPGFIVGRALFSYAMPPPDREFFHLLLQIMEADFFQSLGFQPLVVQGIFDEKAIRNAIQRIIDQHESAYPGLEVDARKLAFTSMANFAESFLRMVMELNLSRA